MKKIYFILSLLLLGTVQLFAQTNTWDGSSSTAWATGANWSLGHAPLSTEDVVIGNFVPGSQPTLSANTTIKSLTMNGRSATSGTRGGDLTIITGITLTISNNLAMNGSTGGGTAGNVRITASLTASISVGGNVTLTNSTGGPPEEPNFILGTGTLSIGGNLTVGTAATFTVSSGTVNYNGGAAQTVAGRTYNNLIFSGGGAKTLGGATTVSTSCTFTSGVVTATSTNVLIFNNDATVSGASNTSYVDGPVRKIGNDNFTFPTGDPLGSYHTIILDNSVGGGATGDSYTAEYFRASALTKGPIASGSGLYGVSHCEYWQLTRGSGSGTPSVAVSWTANSPCSGPYVTTLTGLTVAWLNGSNQWQVAPGTGTNNSGTTTAGTSQRTGVSNFGFFTLGNVLANGSPLPVKFGTIRAYEKQQGIQIDWTIYSEENVLKYQVERSTDGFNFTVIGEVAALNVVSETKYSFFDPNPFSAVNFYRIRNIDIDAKSSFSNIVKVNLDKSVKGITIYPNPVSNGVISFQGSDLAKGNYTLRIVNATGQQVYTQNFNHSGGAINQTIQLPVNVKAGMYTMQMESESARVMSREFIVQ